jgi:hypothetical protein
MKTEQIIVELVVVLKELQTMLGHDDADAVTPQVRPHGGLKGFQSDLTPTIVRRVARRLGHPIPEDVDPINIFVTDDKKQKLSVEEAAASFLKRHGPKGASDERSNREEKDHRQSPQGGSEDVGAYAGASCGPNGPASAVDFRD